jgi:hypothetical protein
MAKPSILRVRVDMMGEDLLMEYSIQKEYLIEALLKGGANYVLMDVQHMIDTCFDEVRKQEEIG